MSAAISLHDTGQSRLLWTPKYCEKSVSFNMERYMCLQQRNLTDRWEQLCGIRFRGSMALIHRSRSQNYGIVRSMQDHLRLIILLVASWINRDQQKIIDYQCPLALKKSGCTRNSTKAIDSDSPISKGVD